MYRRVLLAHILIDSIIGSDQRAERPAHLVQTSSDSSTVSAFAFNATGQGPAPYRRPASRAVQSVVAGLTSVSVVATCATAGTTPHAGNSTPTTPRRAPCRAGHWPRHE